MAGSSFGPRIATVLDMFGRHLLGVWFSCWAGQGHTLTSLCEDIRDRKGIEKEGQRKRKRNEEDTGEEKEEGKKMERRREGRKGRGGKQRRGASVRWKEAVGPGGREHFIKHHGGRGDTNRGRAGTARLVPCGGEEAPWTRHGRSTGEGWARQRSINRSSGLFVTFIFR